MVVLVPIAAAAFAAWRWRQNHRAGVLTKERIAIFKAAMATIEDPEKLNRLAAVYEREGLLDYAGQLRARAELPGKSEAEKSVMQEELKAALASKDQASVLAAAERFKVRGAANTEALLRQYAAGLAASRAVPAVRVSPQQPPTTPSAVQPQQPPTANAPPTSTGALAPGMG